MGSEHRSVSKRPSLTAILAFVSLSSVGVYHTIVGTALPQIVAYLNVSTLKAGLMGSISWLGFTFAVLVCGFLSDYLKSSMVLLVSCGVAGLASLVFGINSNFIFNCVFIGIIGGAGGAIVISTSAFIVGTFSKRRSLFLNYLHFFYTLGAVMGPLIMGRVISENIPWQTVYRFVGGIEIVLFIVLLVSGDIQGGKDRLKTVRGLKGILSRSRLAVLFIIGILAIGAQNGIYYWLVSYLQEIKVVSIIVSGLGLALFSAGMGIGRLIVGYLSQRVLSTWLLLALLILLTISLCFFLFISDANTSVFICLFLGLGCSGIFPLLLSLSSTVLPELSGSAMGILSTSAGIGSIIMPGLISLVSSISTLRMGIVLVTVISFIALCILLLNITHLINSEKSFESIDK